MPVCAYRYSGLVYGGFFLAMLASCTTVPEQKSFPVSASISENIINTLQAREVQVVSLKGLFHAEIDGNGMAFTHSIEGTIFYQRPDQYRIKGFSRFGGLVFDFVLSQGLYALRVKDQPRPILGGMDNLQQLGDLRLPVLLSLRAIDVLLGKLPLSENQSPAFLEREGMYQLDIPPDPRNGDSTLSQRIMIDQRLLQVRQLDYLDINGESVVSIYTSNFRRVRDGSNVETQTILLPFEVTAEDRHQAGSITLEFKEIIANENLDEKLFTLTAF